MVVSLETSPSFLHRIAIVRGEIAQQPVEAVVNSANSSLLGGGGVDGAIHKAAGLELYEACRALKGCATGEAKITKGYLLPAKWIIHTVGPIWKNGQRGEDEKLANCYRSCLALVEQHAILTVAFPAISTGAYGFPVDAAARIALTETVRFLQRNRLVEKIVFVCWTQKAYDCYLNAVKEIADPTETA